MEKGTHRTGTHEGADERLVYVMPAEPIDAREAEGDIARLWRAIVEGRWLIVAITGVCAVAAIGYALFAEQWYRAETVLMPAEKKSTEGLAGQLGGLGGLASLAGIKLSTQESAEPIAVLKSRAFTRAFIEEHKLLPVLFADEWDAKAGRWKAAGDHPDIRDGVRYFNEKVRHVQEDKRTGLVTVSVEWTDPKVAAAWANALIERLNERMRQRSLAEAQVNVTYLRRELATENVVPLQQSIGRVLEHELQKLMLARVTKEYAFRIVDPASPPKWRSWPKRSQVVAGAVLLGGLLAVLVAVVRHAIRGRQPRAGSPANR